jgi:hypothetical protein
MITHQNTMLGVSMGKYGSFQFVCCQISMRVLLNAAEISMNYPRHEVKQLHPRSPALSICQKEKDNALAQLQRPARVDFTGRDSFIHNTAPAKSGIGGHNDD